MKATRASGPVSAVTRRRGGVGEFIAGGDYSGRRGRLSWSPATNRRRHDRFQRRARLPPRPAGPHLRGPGIGGRWPLRAGRVDARTRRPQQGTVDGRGWPHPRPEGRRRVRAGRGELLRRVRAVAAGLGQRAPARTGGRALAGRGRVAGDPPAQPARAHLARERALLRGPPGRPRTHLVVRRGFRPDPVLPGRRGRAALAPGGQRPVRALRRAALRRAQGLVRPVFFPQAPR